MYINYMGTHGITVQRGLSNGVQLVLYVNAAYAHETNTRGLCLVMFRWALVPVYHYTPGGSNMH